MPRRCNFKTRRGKVNFFGGEKASIVFQLNIVAFVASHRVTEARRNTERRMSFLLSSVSLCLCASV